MKFLIGLAKFIIWIVIFFALTYFLIASNKSAAVFFSSILIAWIIFLLIRRRKERAKLPGGLKGAVLQGIWVLGKNLRFEPILKKWESLPVEPKKNYFEFKGNNFRSGDFDEKHKQLPAEWSPFSVEGDNLILGSEFFKKANVKWVMDQAQLVLTIEMATPRYSKSQITLYKKNWV